MPVNDRFIVTIFSVTEEEEEKKKEDGMLFSSLISGTLPG